MTNPADWRVSALRRLSTRALLSVLLLGAGLGLARAAPAEAPPQLPTPADLFKAPSEPIQARIDQAARDIDKNPKFRKFTEQQRKDLVQFVSSNLLFALMHEVGHALVSEMGLPVLGREEDAADSYAVIAMLRIGSTFTEGVLIQAAKSWFLADERAQAEGIKASYYDEHGMDKQRAYQIVCLMVGSDPDKFGKLATDVGMPEERQAACEGDYSNAKWSWEMALKSHRRTTDQPKQKIDAVYGAGKGMFDVYADLTRTIRLLDTIANAESELYVWRSPYTIEMQTCGIQNAHWDLSAKKITICYEIAADFASLYTDYVVLRTAPAKQPVLHARLQQRPCPAGPLDMAAANAIRYYSGGEH